MADADDDLPTGLVFSPSVRNAAGASDPDDDPAKTSEDAPYAFRHRRRRVAVGIAAVAGLALVWPVYPFAAGLRPFVLGLPLSLAWVIGWLVVVFVTFALLYRAEER
jgi:fatty acid desaturase